MSARKLLVLDVALLALMVLASRLALVIHEVGGHAVPFWVFGAGKVTIRLSTLGGGYVTSDKELEGWRNSVMSLGGIALNLATGALAWTLARRLKRRGGPASAALLFLGAGSVAGAVVYLANGFYYGSGDPVGFAPGSGDLGPVQWIWVLFLPAAFGVGWLAVGHYAEFLSFHAALERPGPRVGWLLATVGVVAVAYGGLWALLRDPEREGSTREWRLRREIAKETARRVAVPPPAAAPAKTDPGPAPAVPLRPVVVRAEEVKDRVPSPIGPGVLYGTFALAGLIGLSRTRPGGPGAAFRPAVSVGLAVLAAGVAAAFRLWG